MSCIQSNQGVSGKTQLAILSTGMYIGLSYYRYLDCVEAHLVSVKVLFLAVCLDAATPDVADRVCRLKRIRAAEHVVEHLVELLQEAERRHRVCRENTSMND